MIGILPGQHVLMVEDEMMAWHAAEDNTFFLGIEHCQPMPGDEYSEWQLEESALTVAFWSKKFGFTINHWNVPRHSDTAQGKRSGKSDPGIPFPYDWFIRHCQELREMIG